MEIMLQVSAIPDDKISIRQIPREGDMLRAADAGIVRLKQRLGGGGEADIYATDTECVAKIYKAGQMTQRKKAKIELMLRKNLSCQGICLPSAMLYNNDGEFVGYLMPCAKGVELAKSVFLPMLLKKKFPNWKKIDTVQLCITILNKIKYLHDRDVLIGDINPSNILVVSPAEIYIVDTDSFQIEDFPCPVGTINFTAPEIQRKRFESFLRTKGNENFAIATLLFMIMLPGKPPYSQQGGEDPISNIINMDFSYPFGENSNKKTPDGPWRFMWSHLPYRVKGAFYNTFKAGGKYASENARLSVGDWLEIFSEYHRLLSSGKYGEQDAMSEDLFPTRFKKDKNATYIRCRLCGNEADEKYSKEGICRACLNKGEVYTCAGCGKNLVFSNYHKHISKSERHPYCEECFARLRRSSRSTWRPNSSATGNYSSQYGSPRVSTSSGYSAYSSGIGQGNQSIKQNTTIAQQKTAYHPKPSQQPVPRPTPRTPSKTPASRNAAFWLSVSFAAAFFIWLFVHRMELMEFAFHNARMLRNSGFVFTGRPFSASKMPKSTGNGVKFYNRAPIPDLPWLRDIAGFKSFTELNF